MKKLFSKEAIISILIIVFFVLSSYLSYRYAPTLEALTLLHGLWGMIFYVVVTIVAIVVAPISTFPLLPLAVTLWGSFNAAVLSIVGWSIGGIVAFLLARYGGRMLLKKFIDLKKIDEFSHKIPQTNLFTSVLFLRMAIPVDVLSYALGLFTKMNFWSYTLATIIGVSPFAFIFSYSVQLPIKLQFIGAAVGIIALLFSYKTIFKK